MLRHIEFNRLSNLANFLELAKEEGRMLIRLIKFLKINNKYTYSKDKIQRWSLHDVLFLISSLHIYFSSK